MGDGAQIWRIIAKCAAVLCAVFAALICYSALKSIWKIPLDEWLFFASFTLLVLAIGGMFFWLAWRLWAHWSASTVRWATGTALALILFYIHALSSEWLYARSLGWIVATIALVLLIVFAILYRWLSRKIIVHAKLDDLRDALGEPIGHADRVSLFCTALGWAVFAASFSAIHRWSDADEPMPWSVVFLFLPIVLGYGAYKITLWWMTPKTTPALPAGGFEVIPTEIGKRDEPKVR